jgi:hypothetical protein
MNLSNAAISQLSQPASYIAVHDNTLYAANGGELYKFDGEAASGYIETGEIEYDDDRLTNVYETAVNYQSDGSLEVSIIYDGVEFGPYSTALSDRRVKASRSEAAYARSPRIKVAWPEGTERLDRVTVYTNPHPRRR